MHPYLTDVLTCPRCGPDFGLVLRADEMADGRVRAGSMGCPNCRDAFPVAKGFADLRAPPRRELLGPTPRKPMIDVANLPALLGLVDGTGRIVLAGAPAVLGEEIAQVLPNADVVGIDDSLVGRPESRLWSRMAARPGFPFRTGVARGCVVDARLGDRILEEAVRVAMPRSRIVITHADEAVDEWIAESPVKTLVSGGITVVATG